MTANRTSVNPDSASGQPRSAPLLDPMAVPLAGSHLVEAGAGTGKTWQLTSLYLRLLVERDFPVDRILAVTFTRAATQELSGRIRARLALLRDAYKGLGHGGDPVVEALARSHPEDGPGRVDRALTHFDEAAIHTIHGFCQRVLTAAAFESGAAYGVELAAETGDFVTAVAQDYYRLNFYDGKEEFLLYSKNAKNENTGKPLNIGPNRFIRLLNLYLRHSSITVEGRDERPELAAIEPFGESAKRVREAWAPAREDVEALLRAAIKEKRLHATYYKDAILDSMLSYMEGYCTGAEPLFPLGDLFGKFSSQMLFARKKSGTAPPEHPFFDICQSARTNADILESQCKRLLEFLDTGLFPFAEKALRAAKARKNVQFYSDLVSSLARALKGPGGEAAAKAVGVRYDCALIDEFQDTDPDQYAIFQALFAGQGKPLFLIGDPKQAIYAFRGADVFSYLAAARDAGAVHTINHNRRSDPALVDGVNAMFHRPARTRGDKALPVAPFVLEGIGFTPAVAADGMERPALVLPEKAHPLEIWLIDPEGKGEVSALEARKKIVTALAARISRLVAWGRKGEAWLGNEPLSERHMAVLVRGHAEARMAEKALRRAGLHCVRYSTEKLFFADEASEMLAILRAVARPGDLEAVRAALATETLGRNAGEMARLLNEPEDFGLLSRDFRFWRSLWAGRGFAPLFRAVTRREKVFPRLLALEDGERRVTNLIHLAEILSQAEQEGGLGPEALADWLSRAVRGRETGGDELMLRLESDEDAVKVVTIHASKGLEYPIVFTPFLFAGLKTESPAIFHDPERENRLVMSLVQAADNFNLKKEALAERLRLCYVALTRARNLCTLAWGPINNSGNSPLAWLFHGPGDEGDEALSLWLAGSKERLKNVEPGEIKRSLAPLVEVSGGAVGLQPLPDEPVPLPPAPGREGLELGCRKFAGVTDTSFKITSYSALAARSDAVEEPETRDFALFPWEYNTGPEREGPPDIFDFPKGADAGQFFHDLLENWDFTEKDEGLLASHVRDRLSAHGFSEEWEGPVRDMVERLVSTQLSLDFPGLALSSVALSDRVNEMEFVFPMAFLTPQKLASAFSGSPILERVPENFSELGFSGTRGFLHGFMDMVFVHQGRYFLVDWKSNHLGTRPEDYDEAALCRAMAGHSYTLQYHLYVLALHRHLGLRLPDYSYDRHFGGVFYIFIRGADKGFGVFADRPQKELILSLERLFQGEARNAAGGSRP